MATFFTLPPHLLDKIQELVEADLHLPAALKAELRETVSRFTGERPTSIRKTSSQDHSNAREEVREDEDRPASSLGEDQEDMDSLHPSEAEPPPTINYETLETLSRWADRTGARTELKRNGLGIFSPYR